MNDNRLSELLVDGITQLGLSVTDNQLRQLISYKDILLRWNKVYSLTAITNPRELIIQHLLDGLSIVNHIMEDSCVLDVGSGMGVPGIILAIMLPKSKITVLDSNSKKSAFLQQVKIELELSNLSVVCKRVELYIPDELFTIITSRAFADLALFIQLTEHLIADNGLYLAMKAERGLSEMKEIDGFACRQIGLNVPYLDAKRFLIEMKRA
ncbi:MAG TPA: 16S rRNA (guanine(527)-N(7))-methyltransferase RsmG [Burkholderiales bacterium]|nr:16S rRNA (guanine(527)-N(7))-methyltransferase RsmG [Burkholderiales bacterium]